VFIFQSCILFFFVITFHVTIGIQHITWQQQLLSLLLLLLYTTITTTTITYWLSSNDPLNNITESPCAPTLLLVPEQVPDRSWRPFIRAAGCCRKGRPFCKEIRGIPGDVTQEDVFQNYVQNSAFWVSGVLVFHSASTAGSCWRCS